jgi:outer membrane lipoprotein-sorting protein
VHFLRTTSTARVLALVLGVALVAAATAAIALAATGGSGQKPPPKPLAQAVHDALAAPEVDGVTARIKFTNHLIDAGAVVGQTPLISGASGRLWASSGGKVRLELQSTSGDVQVTSDGKSFLVYDGGSNTAYRGEIPQQQGQSKPDAGTPSLRKVQKSIDQARQHGSVSGAIPTTVAGRPAYEVRVTPQHGGLVSGARLAWDAVRGVPLKVSVYARGNASPVLSLSAQNISFGKVAASTFAISPPKGAHVVDLTPRSGGSNAAHGKDVTGLSAVQKAVGFGISAPDQLAGKSRRDVKQVGHDGALVTYGQGLDGIAVFEKKAGTQTQTAPPSQHGDNGLSLPTVSINGTTGQELPTALGTVVRFTRGGVEYTVLGSQTADTVIAAARAL